MDKDFLEGLGLTVVEHDGVVEAGLELGSGLAFNPLSRQAIPAVTFTVVGDRLIFVGPPELVGAAPINLAFITAQTRLEDLVVQQLNEHLFQLERRSRELSSLGIAPQVDPQSLLLSADMEQGTWRFVLGCSRQGQFRVAAAWRDGAELSLSGEPTAFELSEFREKPALGEFLEAMFHDRVEETPTAPLAVPLSEAISFTELARAFGEATLPVRSPLELVCQVQVRGELLRFAAARVQGRTFRGLLAGPSGKLWADRFNLEDFPGVRAKVAEVLEVPVEDVEVMA